MNWKRAIIGGVLAELLLVVLLLPFLFVVGFDSLADPNNVPPVILGVVIGGSFITNLLLMQWVARRVTSRFVMHGALVGLAAFTFYIIPVVAGGGSQSPMYWLAHAMKLLGGMCGGVVAARRRDARTSAAVV
jgi:putative membrane protein (TIGR04086 family)